MLKIQRQGQFQHFQKSHRTFLLVFGSMNIYCTVLIGSFIPLLGLGTDVVDGTLGKLPLVKNLNARQRTELVVDIADIGLHFLGVPPLHFDETIEEISRTAADYIIDAIYS